MSYEFLSSIFWQKGDSHDTMNTEFHTPFEWFMLMYIYRTWMEETYYYIPNQGRRQGVCLGGGGGGGGGGQNGQNVSLLLREAKHFAPSLRHISFRLQKFFNKHFNNGVGVVSSWPWLTAELTSQKKNHTGGNCPPPPVAPPLYLTKVPISSWLLNQIGWGFRRNADN